MQTHPHPQKREILCTNVSIIDFDSNCHTIPPQINFVTVNDDKVRQNLMKLLNRFEVDMEQKKRLLTLWYVQRRRKNRKKEKKKEAKQLLTLEHVLMSNFL